MSSLLPVALYGLEVPPGEMMIPAAADFPATVSAVLAPLKR
jgi:FK506-binding nuclear protein